MLTVKQVNKKYKGVYIEFISTYDYSLKQWSYEICKTSATIRENMTLGEDVGTSMEYRR